MCENALCACVYVRMYVRVCVHALYVRARMCLCGFSLLFHKRSMTRIRKAATTHTCNRDMHAYVTHSNKTHQHDAPRVLSPCRCLLPCKPARALQPFGPVNAPPPEASTPTTIPRTSKRTHIAETSLSYACHATSRRANMKASHSSSLMPVTMRLALNSCTCFQRASSSSSRIC